MAVDGGGGRSRRQPGCLGVIHVGQHKDRGRVLEQPVRHLVQRQADVLEAELLAGDIERHMGKARVHRAHHPRQNRAVAAAGIAAVELLTGDAARRLRLRESAERFRSGLQRLGYDTGTSATPIVPVLLGEEGAAKSETRAMVAWARDEILKLLHPFMPFITEELWAVTAERDANPVQELRRLYGHVELGVHAEVIERGRFAVGDAIEVLPD